MSTLLASLTSNNAAVDLQNVEFTNIKITIKTEDESNNNNKINHREPVTIIYGLLGSKYNFSCMNTSLSRQLKRNTEQCQVERYHVLCRNG